MVGLEKDCGVKCRSHQHAQQLISAVSKGNLRQIQLFLTKCHNATSVSDRYGRTVLHVAASCGKWQVLDWLISEKGAGLTVKDAECHWTALHRALFHGQLTSARLLISYGASTLTRDREGLTALDITMKDKLPHVEFVQSGLNEVCTWGDNANFTLGHENEQRRRYPEVVEIFRRKAISIKQVLMCKYHTVFLSTAGRVFTCGHGRGGRLGQGSELTSLEPSLVAGLDSKVCQQIAASADHTVLLMENGSVYSCGLNDCHQLGQLPPPKAVLLPKLMNSKQLKGRVITGVLAQRFHTVLYNQDSVFTFGLNAGQLGQQKVPGEAVFSHPRQVSALMHKDMSVKLVSASDAATVVVTNKGDVYTLHEYQCRRIFSKRLDIEQVCVCGGHLDHGSNLDLIKEHGGIDLVVAIRTTSGKIYVWRSNEPTLKRCAWVLRRPLLITDMSLNIHSLAFITKDGEAFLATLPKRKYKGTMGPSSKEVLASSPPTDGFSLSLSELVSRDEAQEFSIERVPLIHRAVNIIGDVKGRNYAVLQAQSNASLTEIPSVQDSRMIKHFQELLGEADTLDSISDVLLQVGTCEYPAHRFVLAYRSDYFHKQFVDNSDTSGALSNDKPVIQIDNVYPEIFRQLLQFMYTDSCDLLTVGKMFTFCDGSSGGHQVEIDSVDEMVVTNGRKMSAFEVNQKKNKTGNHRGRATKGKHKTTAKTRTTKSPVTLLQEAAKRFGVKTLVKRLEAVRYKDGIIEKIPGTHIPQPKLTFYWTKFPHLYDVSITGEGGSTLQCHKCVLVARLEYFRSMLASGWMETANCKSLSLAVPGDILLVIIDYLYIDDSSAVKGCTDAEFLCNVLVLADQLLIERLVDLCEVRIASLITLKNSCELLEFASLYNARQLKTTCQQFIVINLAALLETRSLDVLGDDVIEELSGYYRDTIPGMCRRRLTPYECWPDVGYLEQLEAEHSDIDLHHTVTTDHAIIKKTRGKKKRTRTHSSGDDGHEKSVSAASPVSDVQNPDCRPPSNSSDAVFVVELSDIHETAVNSPETDGINKPSTKTPQCSINNCWSTIKVRIPATLAAPSISAAQLASTQQPVPVRQTVTLGSVSGSQDHTGNIIDAEPCVLRPAHSGTVGHGTANPEPVGLGTANPEPVGLGTAHPEPVGLGTLNPEPMGLGTAHPEPLGLREIMAQEAASVRSQPRAVSTPGSSKKFIRISQKERRRRESQSEAAAESPTQDRGVDGTKPTGHTPTANPWVAIAPVVQSFKDLLLTEVVSAPSNPINLSTVPSPGGSSDPTTMSWGLLTPGRSKKTVDSTPSGNESNRHDNLSPSSPTDNPWQSVANRPLARHSLSFNDILQDELQLKQTLDRVKNKPLARIQMEEQAIQELLVHYQADQTYDEYITVERVHALQATPTWAATQRHKDS